MIEVEDYVTEGCELPATESEIALRERVVYPLLRSLGWDSSEIHQEKSIKGIRVDYLIKNSSGSFALEVKSPKKLERYDEYPHDQLRRYVSELETDYGILYDGRMLFLFKREGINSVPLRFIWQCNHGFGIFEALKNDAFPIRLNEFLLSLPSYDRVPTVKREQLSSLPNGEIIICPGSPEDGETNLDNGEDWATHFNAWRAITISRYHEPIYFALYATAPKMQVTLFGEIEQIRDVSDQSLQEKNRIPIQWYKDAGKKVIIFKKGSLRRLSDPIVKPTNYRRISTIFSSLSTFISARTIADLKEE